MKNIFFILSLILISIFLHAVEIPKGGVSVIGKDFTMNYMVSAKDKNIIKSETVKVKEKDFNKALRIYIISKPELSYQTQITVRNKIDLKQGDAALAVITLKCEKTESESGEGKAEFVFESSGGDYLNSVTFPMNFSGWKVFYIPFIIKKNYKIDEAQCNIRLGFAKQTVLISNYEVIYFGSKVSISDLPSSLLKVDYEGRNPEASWRAEADKRIDKIRKDNLNIKVVDAGNRPVKNASINIDMKKHSFGFGSAVDASILMGNNNDSEKYRDHIKKMFNKIVFENDLKWPNWENLSKRQTILNALKWIKENDIAVRGHCLIWPSWKRMPKDLIDLKNDKSILEKRINDHFKDEVSLIKDYISEWDVINEPYTNHDIMDILGDDVMVKWFNTVSQIDTKSRLFINDFSILSNGGNDAAHQAHYEKTIKYLIQNKAPLGGIGLQSHFGHELTSPEKLLKILDRFSFPGVSIQSTEFDIDIKDEEAQADYLRDFMTILFSHQSVNGIVMWGFWEGRHWKPDAALFRKDWSIKPNGKAWLDLVFSKWWTKVSGSSDENGAFNARGFLGEYEIQVIKDGKTAILRTHLTHENKEIRVVLK